MTGNKEYSFQDFLHTNRITNRLVPYNPDEAFTFTYFTNYPRFEPVEGPYDPTQFDLSKKIVHPAFQDYFDACADGNAYRHTSFRGKRRQHALQLAADFRRKPVYHFEEWFDDTSNPLLSNLLDLLRAFCHGVRVTFEGKGTMWYQINSEVMHQLQNKLIGIANRTEEVTLRNRDDIPPLPEFGQTSHLQYPNLSEAFFSANDWEILAATYRKEVETFIQTCSYIGFDFEPYEPPVVSNEPKDLESSPYPEDHEPPPPISPSVQRIIQESFKSFTAQSQDLHEPEPTEEVEETSVHSP
jgi:hypothetical protein